MLDCHIKAFLIRPGRVLGRKLRPLTLAHLWILEAVGSPYAYNQPPAYTDMVYAVFVLSFPAWLSRWFLMHHKAQQAVFWLWGKLHRGFDVEGDLAAFGAYWKAYTDKPNRYDSKTHGRASCLPSSVNVAWAIMGKVGERRAWSMPLPLAITYFTAETECNGAEYVTERDKYLAQLNADFGKEVSNG